MLVKVVGWHKTGALQGIWHDMMDGVLSVFPVLENDYFSLIACVYQVK